MPCPFGEMLFAYYASDVENQSLQHRYFTCGQIDGFAVHKRPASYRVELESPVDDLRASAELASTHECPCSSLQFRQIERLRQVIIRAEVKSLDSDVQGIARRQDQDGCRS